MSRGCAKGGLLRLGWLLTVVQTNLPAVLAGSLMLALLVVGATFLFHPIYSAETVLTLDSELTKVLKGVSDSYPSQAASDYIRNEYFATHSLSLMRMPAIASKLIASRHLQTRSGGALYEGRLVNPGLVTLLYSNAGRGIFLKWIADTQQFSISGLSRDPDEAVALSSEYTNLFLEQSVAQYAEVCTALAARFSSRIEKLEASIAETGSAIRRVRERYNSIDVDEEAVQISHRIEAIRQQLDSEALIENTYATRLDEAKKAVDQYQELILIERTVEANPRIDTLRAELLRLVQEEAGAVDFTSEHPIIVSLHSRMDAVRAAIKSEADKSLQSEVQRLPSMVENLWQTMLALHTEHLLARYRLEHYTRLHERYLARQRELGTAAQELTPLKEKLDSLTTLHAQALSELTTVQSLVDHTLPFFRIVSPAAINTAALKHFKYFPRRRALALSALIGSFFVLGLLAIARELYRDRFFGTWQFDETSGSPSVVVDGGSLPVLTNESEAARYRFVRQACLALRDATLVCVASLTRGEGRQTVARVLAWSQAQSGRSVLLVDADTANRSLTLALGLAGLPGVQDVLSQSASLDSCVVRDAPTGAAVLPAGNGSLAGRDVALLLEQARLSWERVVVVLPPDAEDAALTDLLPPHRKLLVAAWGQHERAAVARIAGVNADPGQPPVLVVTQAPALLDLTTIRGLVGLACQTGAATVSWRSPWRRK